MEQKDGLNVLRCRQELEATTKQISKTPEGNNKMQHQTILNSALKHRSNLSHPSRPPPPPPERNSKNVNKNVNYALTKEYIGEKMSHKDKLRASSDNKAFIKSGQDSQSSVKKNASSNLEGHHGYLNNSRSVIAATSNMSSSSFGFDKGITKEGVKQPKPKASSVLDDTNLLNDASVDMFSSGSVDNFLINAHLNPNFFTNAVFTYLSLE